MYFILVLIFIIISSFAIAQSEIPEGPTKLDLQIVEIYKTEEQCFELAIENDQMKDCSDQKLKVADAMLNEIYTSRITSLKKRSQMEASFDQLTKTADETLKRLITAQTAWIAFRDADCDLMAAEMLSTSSEELIKTGCLAEKTVKRIKEIAPTLTEASN